MIKICRSSLAATLAALMLTVPIVAADDSANQAGGNEREITEIRLPLKPDKALPRYLGSELNDPKEIVKEYLAGYKIGNDSYLGNRILKDVKLEYVTQNHKPYQDKILWPLKKNAQGYEHDKSKDPVLKLTFSVSVDNNVTYKIDTAKVLKFTVDDKSIEIPANTLQPIDGKYALYFPLDVYRQIRFTPDEGVKKLYVTGNTDKLNNPLTYDANISGGETTFAVIGRDRIKNEIKDEYQFLGLYLKLKNENFMHMNPFDPLAFLNLDENKKAAALAPLEVTLRTRKNNDNDLPPILNGKDATINEGEKFDLYSLIDSLLEEVNNNTEGNKDNIKFEKGKFDEKNPTHGTYKITMSYTNKNNKTATWTSTVTVVAKPKPKPPVPAPQPQPKQQEKTGNAYFDLGRYNLPPCPDSKCAKSETSAKKDDVPNTAAAVNY